jgi:hypothetical protein
VLKQAEVGVSVAEPIRKVGISEQTFYRLEKPVCRLGVGPGPGNEASTGREQPAEATDGGVEPG